MINKKILFVINPKSRAILKKNTFEDTIDQIASVSNFSWEIYYTTGKNDKDQLNHQINTFNPGIIIAVGGDGTANMVAGAIIDKKISMSVIPAGSANGLAFNLGIPGNFEEALKKILDASPRLVDVIRINKKFYCLHLSDVGINARIVKRFSEEKSKGLAGYGKQLLKELFSPKTSFKFTVEIPGYDKKRKAEMLVIANAPAYGTGAVINPKGAIDDGKFEIVIIKPYPWWIVFRFVAAFFSRNLHKMKYVQIIEASQAKITLDSPQDMHVDGEVHKPVKTINAEILPETISMLY